jgi:hypothetical protein
MKKKNCKIQKRNKKIIELYRSKKKLMINYEPQKTFLLKHFLLSAKTTTILTVDPSISVKICALRPVYA